MRKPFNPNPHQFRDKVIKNKASVPRRERWLVQNALTNLNVRYWQAVEFWNPAYTGLRRVVDGGWQWLDFVLRMPYGAAALIFKPSYSSGRPHLFELRALEQKKAFLESKGIPYLVLSRHQAQDEYEVLIEFWMRKEKRKHEKHSRSTN